MFLKIRQLFILPMHTAAGAHNCVVGILITIAACLLYVFAYVVVKTRLPYSFFKSFCIDINET